MTLPDTHGKTWAELIQPCAIKCELAAKLNMNACWNPDGAKALGQMLTMMAELLDGEIAQQRANGEFGSKDK